MKRRSVAGWLGLAMGIVWVGLAQATNALPSQNATRNPTRSMLIPNVTFVVFDTETTGFSPSKDRIVELAAIKFRDGKIIGQKDWLINPRRSIPYYVQQVHGITPEMVKNKPTFQTIYPEFAKFIEGCVLMAHNAPFDLSFMRAEIMRNGYQIPRNLTIDSLSLFRKWYPQLTSYRLKNVVEAAHVQADNYHRADVDSLYVFLIFEKYLQEKKLRPRLGDIYSDAGGPLSF